ncbi:MAG: FliO/MopB family protein [Rubrivivax sp.]|jgi:flagellar protein FliO/FliZ
MPNNGLNSLLWFLAIIAAIPAVLWLMKRAQQTRAGGAGPVRPIAVLPLSPSQKLVTVEVGQGDSRCWLVLGVTPQAINLVTTMLPQDPPATTAAATDTKAAPAMGTGANPQQATFAQLLQRLQGRGPDAR